MVNQLAVKNCRILIPAIILGCITLAAAASPAEAAFKCKNGDQLVGGEYIATPYCQDELLTQVAREYRLKVSASEIRWNPNFKRHICQLIGADIRVRENCRTASPGVRGRPF